MGTANVGQPVVADDGEPAGRPTVRNDMPSADTLRASRAPASTARRELSLRGRRPGRPGDEPAVTARSAVSVLADRLAAALVHHEPGWRLPRQSALARRYNVSAAEIDAAVEDLASRHLVRRLADGQVYRASPAEYVIDLEGIAGLAARLDAMGAEFACRSRQVSWRLPPEDIAWALRMAADQQVCVVRYLWTADSVPAALITTYVPGDIASRSDTGLTSGSPSVLNLFQLTGVPGGASAEVELEGTAVGLAGADPAAAGSLPMDSLPVDSVPVDSVPVGTSPVGTSPVGTSPVGAATALHLELQAPPPSVARSLRLGAGQPAMIVTIRFDEAASGRPVALSIAVLRPEMFRLVLQTPFRPPGETDAGNPAGSWTHAVEGWEP